MVVVEPSPDIAAVLDDACSNNFKITLLELLGNSKDFNKIEPDVINFKSLFSFAIIPFFPVGPNVILIESSIALIVSMFVSNCSNSENFFFHFLILIVI